MPTVKLIEFTGMGHPDPLRAARVLVYAKSTRLTQGEEARARINSMPTDELEKELQAVANSVRSSWEFCSYVFEVGQVTRACANQITRTRFGVSFAQEAMRVTNQAEFQTRIPETVVKADGGAAWRNLMAHIAQTYRFYQNLGAPNQDARGVLPLNIHTNLLARYDLRALADLVGKRDNLRAQDEYSDIARAMKAEVFLVHPWARIFLEPERLKTPELDAILQRALDGRSPVDAPEVNAALKQVDALKGTWG
jgi:flavin-dependent thymidylate synthase